METILNGSKMWIGRFLRKSIEIRWKQPEISSGRYSNLAKHRQIPDKHFDNDFEAVAKIFRILHWFKLD